MKKTGLAVQSPTSPGYVKGSLKGVLCPDKVRDRQQHVAKRKLRKMYWHETPSRQSSFQNQSESGADFQSLASTEGEDGVFLLDR